MVVRNEVAALSTHDSIDEAGAAAGTAATHRNGRWPRAELALVHAADPTAPRAPARHRRESSARTYSRRLPIVLAAGEGVHVRDTDGRTYLDCLAGAGALALGHNHPAVTSALRAVLDRGAPMTTLDLATPLREAFVETLFDALPASLRDGRIQFCGPTGADAVEAAIKLARTATGRGGAIAFGGAYHGMTQGTMALSGAHAPKAALGPLGGDVQHLPFPTSYRCPFGGGRARRRAVRAHAALGAERRPQRHPAAGLDPRRARPGRRPRAPRAGAVRARCATRRATPASC
jgi:diaminobutyrate-2-oxoglutarate transaminase